MCNETYLDGVYLNIPTVITILASLLCLIFFIFLYTYRNINLKIKQQSSITKTYTERIKQLDILLNKHENTIANLKLKSIQVSKIHNETLNHYQSAVAGIQHYVSIIQDRNISQLSTQEVHNLINCYKQIDRRFFRWIEKRQIQLTPREIILCILIRMGKDKQDIINLLHCSDGSYRTIKNRVKNKINIKTEYHDIDYLIKELR